MANGLKVVAATAVVATAVLSPHHDPVPGPARQPVPEQLTEPAPAERGGVCQMLADGMNLWEVEHDLAFRYHEALVPVVIPAVEQEVRDRCPDRLPTVQPEVPATGRVQPHTGTSVPQPPEPDWYGDEPFGPPLV